jgi:outer membrane autotransporter protein
MSYIRCGGLCLLLITSGLSPVVWADTVSSTDSYSPATTTRFPLPFPSGSVATTFTSYTGTAFPFTSGTFFVGTAGSFSATVTGVMSGVGIFIIRGTFEAASGSDPTTLLSDVLAGTQAPATIPSVSLTPGQLYTFLVVLSSGSGTATVTIEGIGCVRLGSACATFVPISTTVTADLAALLDALGGSISGDLATAISSLSALSETAQSTALERLVPLPSHNLAVSTRAAMTSALDRISVRLDTLRVTERAGDDATDPLRYAVTGLASGDAPVYRRPRQSRVWLTSYGLSGRRGDDGQYAGYRSHGWGATLGADRELRPGLVAGVALSYSDTALSYHNQRVGDRSGAKSTQLSLYGSREMPIGYLEAMFAFSQQRYESRRNTTVNGIANGDFDGAQWGLRLGGGVPIKLDIGVDITPKASLEWNQIRQDSYTESTGGPLALHVDSNTARRWRSSLGVEITRDSEVADTTVQPYLRTFWHRDLKDDGVDSVASFVGGGTAFTAPGQELERDTYSAGAGVRVFATDRLSASVGYDMTLGKDYRAHTFQLTARWDF